MKNQKEKKNKRKNKVQASRRIPKSEALVFFREIRCTTGCEIWDAPTVV